MKKSEGVVMRGKSTKLSLSCAAFLFLCMLACVVGVASAKTIYVPDDYERIRWAVDNASAGDTIVVRDGIYVENIDISKPHLTIKSENGSTNCIISSAKSDNVFEITANYVKILGFTIKNASYPFSGILLRNSDYCNISSNVLLNNWYGIRLKTSNNTILSNNILNSNNFGIYLSFSDNNIIEDNVLSNNGDGIYLYCSGSNTLENNRMSGNDYNFGVSGNTISDFMNDIDTSNKVNEKPIYYWINEQNKQVPSDAGFVGVINSKNIVVKDITLTNNYEGILFAFASDSRIENVVILNNNVGVYLLNSDNNTIKDSIIKENDRGVVVEHNAGIVPDQRNMLINNDIVGNKWGYGIYANNCIITNNTISHNWYGGIGLGSDNIVSNNEVLDNDNYGIGGDERSKDNAISSNLIQSNENGIYFYSSVEYIENITVTNNIISNNDWDGISFSYVIKDIYITNNTIRLNKGHGIFISGYNISNNINLINNKVSENKYGISIGVNKGILRNNILFKNRYNFHASGNLDIDTSNKIDGKPIYYWIDESDKEVPKDAGYVGLVNCRNITIKDIEIRENYEGLFIMNSQKIKIENVTVSDNIYGIYSESLNDSIIKNNNITANYEEELYYLASGLYLQSSNNNFIAYNNISYNSYGIDVVYSNNNTIVSNTISQNLVGIELFGFHENNIYLNNFINNDKNVNSYSLANWNSTEPITYIYNGQTFINYLGNYWSDYTGSDADGDGIGDTPYVINEDNKDYHPLMQPWENYFMPDLTIPFENITLSKIGDTTVINVTVLNIGGSVAKDIVVYAYDGSEFLGSAKINELKPGSQQVVYISTDRDVKELKIVVDPENRINECDESNNVVYAHIVDIWTVSFYDTFYKYKNIEGDDPVLVGVMVSDTTNDNMKFLQTNVESKIYLNGQWFKGYQQTDENGRAWFLFDDLPEGEYTVYFTVRDETQGYLSYTVSKNIKIVETNVNMNLLMTPGDYSSYKEIDAFNDGIKDYVVDVGGECNVKVKLSSDVELRNAKVVVDPLAYYRNYGGYEIYLGNINPGEEKSGTLTFEIRNGERYAIVEYAKKMGWDDPEGRYGQYALKVAPTLYLFFEDEDGKIHKAYKLPGTGDSLVFPHSESGMSDEVTTSSISSKISDEIKGFVVKKFVKYVKSTEGEVFRLVMREFIAPKISLEHFDKTVGGAIMLHAAGKKIIFTIASPPKVVEETIKTVKILQEQPSESRAIKGVARWIGLSTAIIGLGMMLGLSGPPGWVLLGAGILELGLDIYADIVHQAEMDLEQQFKYDVETLLNMDEIREDRADDEFLVFADEKLVTLGAFVYSTFFNTQPIELNCSYQIELLNDDGFILESEDGKFKIPAGGMETKYAFWSQMSPYDECPTSHAYILRYSVGDGYRKHISTHIVDGVGIRKVRFLNESGDYRSAFLKGERVGIEFEVYNTMRSNKNVEIEVIVYGPNGNEKFHKTIQDCEIDPGENTPFKKLNAFKADEVGTYKVSIYIRSNGKLLDKVEDFYEFVVFDQTMLSTEVSTEHSIKISLNLTDATGNPISNANVSAEIKRPDGIRENLNLTEEFAGHYTAIYTNDTVFGPYIITLTAEKQNHTPVYDTIIVNKQNKSSIYFENITVSKLITNKTAVIRGYIKNNGSYYDNIAITIEKIPSIKCENRSIILKNVSHGEERVFEFEIIPLSSGELFIPLSIEFNNKTLNGYIKKAYVLHEISDISITLDSDVIGIFGREHTYKVYISNKGNVNANVSLNVSTSNNWTATLSTYYLSLEPDETKEVNLIITPSQESSAIINITAESHETNDSVSLYCYIVPRKSIVRISPDVSIINITTNQSVILNYTISEIGGMSDATLGLNFSLIDRNGNFVPHQIEMPKNINVSKGGSIKFAVKLKINKSGLFKGILKVYENNSCKDWSEIKIWVFPAITIYVPDDYAKIQEAVRNAAAGDTIIVRDGVYQENIDVDKPLTLRSENGSENCIVQAAYPYEDVFYVAADHVNISGFTIKSGRRGIYLDNVENCYIANDTVSSNEYGIVFHNSSNNTIANNTVSNNHYGIALHYSSGNAIYLNNFIGNTDQVYSSRSTNIWNSTSQMTYTYEGRTYTNYMGNYWSDYKGSDADGDGIGDTPYSIDSDKDNYPLMERFENYIVTPVPNQPPVANFTYSPEKPVVNQSVTFDASSSYDPDGKIMNYEWDFGDGNITNTTEEKINHSYSEAGSYDVTLTVKDDDGATNSTTKIITVYSPTAIFDTGRPENPYPSISGKFVGMIITNTKIIAKKLYTYACEGTGGHTEYAIICNKTWCAYAEWEGYKGDWMNIYFNKTVVLMPYKTYNITIVTGSYPQIHHTSSLKTENGWINCTEFIDANGKKYYEWIPAIKLW